MLDNSGGGTAFTNYLWHQLLAQNGYIVVSVDGRGLGKWLKFQLLGK